MQIKVTGESPFQILSSNFTIGPSESGYDLMFSADGVEYSKLFTVGANTNRQVTQVAAGSYYFLSGNTDTVTVNWMKNCGGSGSGGDSYVLPVASENTLGGVKIGSGLTMSGDTLNANTGGYTLPMASAAVLGGVKIGSGITIDENGVISADVQSGGTNDYYVGWDDLFDMDYAPRRAAFAEIVEKYNAGYHIYASGTTAASNGYDAILPLVEFIPGTWSTDRYVGGWAKFTAVNSSGSTSGYYAASFNSSGNITPNAKYFSKSDFYTLQNATVSRLGGVKVGSGLTMDGNDNLNVAIGDGLAFSGNTLVVSGGTSSNTRVVMLNKLTQQERLDLYNELASLYDYQNSGWSSAYTEDMFAFYLDLRSLADQQAANVQDVFEGFFPMECVRMHPTDYGGAAFFTGVEGNRVGNGWLIDMRYIIAYDGSVDGPSSWDNGPVQLPENVFVSFTSAGTAVNVDAYNFARACGPDNNTSMYAIGSNGIKIVDANNTDMEIGYGNIIGTRPLTTADYADLEFGAKVVFEFMVGDHLYRCIGDIVYGGQDEGWHLGSVTQII